ncbi:hypothetical protein [Streptomyces decoyicus]
MTATDTTVHRCEQCGRTGTRGFKELAAEEHNIRIVVCSNGSACRKRWPTSTVFMGSE